MDPRSILLPCWILGGPLLAAQPLDASPPGPDLRNVARVAIVAKRETPGSREGARVQTSFPPTTQVAVEKALVFLAGEQNKDGSWGENFKVATTSLALLAFLGNGECPVSEEFGEGITSGILYLLDRSRKAHGRLASGSVRPSSPTWPHEHALATQALAESYLICSKLGINLPGLKRETNVAAQWIIDQTHKAGGWAEHFSEASKRGPDVSLTVPLLHALWLVHRGEIETRNLNKAVRRTLDLIGENQIADGGIQFPALATHQNKPMTGGCAFAFQIAERGAELVARRALRFVVKRADDSFHYHGETTASDLHALHYEALAMYFHGGKAWQHWHKPRIAELLKHQEDGGSFAPQTDKPVRHPRDTALQRTSLACLVLETPWRYTLK